MKWLSHLILTKLVIQKINFNFPKDFINGLLKGCIEPDKIPDYKIVKKGDKVIKQKIPHHVKLRNFLNNELLRYYFSLALYLYKYQDYYTSGLVLGRVIHYVQDSVIYKYRNEKLHNKIEEEINYVLKHKLKEVDCKIEGVINEVLNKTYLILVKFIQEIGYLSNDVYVNRIKKFFLTIRLLYILIPLIFSIASIILLISHNFQLSTTLILSLLISFPILHFLKLKISWKAFKLGLIRLKLRNYITVY